MPSPPNPDRRARRRFWVVAGGMAMVVLAWLGHVAFWPTPSPDPYLREAIKALNLDTSPQAVAAENAAAAELQAITHVLTQLTKAVVTQYKLDQPAAARPSDPPIETRFLWRRNSEYSNSPEQEEALIERARRAVQAGLPDRIAALARARSISSPAGNDERLLNRQQLDDLGIIRWVAGFTGDLLWVAVLDDDPAAAVQALESILALSRHASQHRGFVGALVSASIQAAANDVIAGALPRFHPSEPTLAALHRVLADAPHDHALFERTLAYERPAMIQSVLVDARRESPTRRLGRLVTREPSHHDQIASISRSYDALSAVAQSRDPRLEPDCESVPPIRLFAAGLGEATARDSCAALRRMRVHLIAADTHLDATRLRIAIELYRARRLLLPATLSDLVPSILPSIPQDPYAADQQFRYRVNASQTNPTFTLYSVGLDGVDNNATPAPRPHDLAAPLVDDTLTGADAVFTLRR